MSMMGRSQGCGSGATPRDTRGARRVEKARATLRHRPARRARASDAGSIAIGAVALALVAMATLMLLAGCADGGGSERQGPDVARHYADELGVDLDAMTRRPDGLHVLDVRVGTGSRADSGDVVTVHYTGWLPDGTQFDSSRDRDRPLEVALGYGRVIDGWDRGIVGMRVGGQRRLVIPPELAYGTDRNGPIPANATLVFDVELLDVENRTPEDGQQPGDTAAAAAPETGRRPALARGTPEIPRQPAVGRAAPETGLRPAIARATPST